MGLVLLVRHGQASFGADDYDVLSATGRSQAAVLGQAVAALTPDLVVHGSLVRQRDTARLMAEGGIRDFHQAKLKAANRLGIHDDASLPRNREIEDALRQCPGVRDCAVVGVDDPEWGQRICAAVETGSDARWQPEAARIWLAERLAPYKLPRAWQVVDTLPRNAMGKVVKPDVARWFGSPEAAVPMRTRS